MSRLEPGDPLPSTRVLKKTFSVSLDRLKTIFDEMDGQGLVERHARRGIFKAAAGEVFPRIQCIDLFACGIDAQRGELIEAFTAQAGRMGYGVRLRQFTADDTLTEYESIITSTNVKACVLLGLRNPGVPAMLDRHHVAHVSLLPNCPEHTKPTIALPPNIVELQINHLCELGHTRIAYLTGENPTTAYHSLMTERNLPIEPHWLAHAGCRELDVLLALKQVFSAEPYPTAIIVQDAQLPATYRFLEGLNYVIGTDFSVIGTGDLAIAESMFPAATTVRTSLSSAAKLAIQTLERIIAGNDVQQTQHIPAELIIRQSTSKPSE